jgi:diguanylate cyclase
MHYNLLPSVMLLTVVTADRINTGIRGLWLRSLPGMALSAAAGGLLTGYAFRPETSTTVLLACLPMLMAYTLSVSLYAHRLVRKVQAQNRKLAELSRLDSLTGLGNRGHWQAQAEQLLQARHALGVRATLLLADIDHFKAINDGWGHGLGDDVLNAVANEIKLCIRGEDSAGRIGGDEFAIAIRADLLHAESLAERLCRQVEALHFPQQPELRCSISLGLAEAGDGDRHLRDWLESADRALYRAKHGGRNRVGSAPAPSLGQPGSR